MLDAEQLAEVCDMIAEGKTLRAICKEKGYKLSSVSTWLARNPEAHEHSMRAREHGCDALADQCIEIADNPTIDPADKRIRIDTRIRLIGKWSQRYSDKLTVNNNTTVTHKHDLSNLDTAELEQLEAILAKSERGSGDTGKPVAASVH